ncbi:MAG: hypothetical protein LQ340_001557 [Diploschistes diacapsis]|nr:MAG: hypothetical protein LQ340_001557 [Diploschistes diacapsis]
MSVPRSRILDLIKTQCRIFSTTYNPERLRLGNKILRQRLKGPTLAAYYPRKVVNIKDVQRAFPECTVLDEDEMERFEKLAAIKRRGKGAPKKKSSAAAWTESKKFNKKKKAPAVAGA